MNINLLNRKPQKVNFLDDISREAFILVCGTNKNTSFDKDNLTNKIFSFFLDQSGSWYY